MEPGGAGVEYFSINVCDEALAVPISAEPSTIDVSPTVSVEINDVRVNFRFQTAFAVTYGSPFSF